MKTYNPHSLHAKLNPIEFDELKRICIFEPAKRLFWYCANYNTDAITKTWWPNLARQYNQQQMNYTKFIEGV